MDTLSTPAIARPTTGYPAASPELDFMANPETIPSEKEAQQMARRPIVKYSWWKTVGENAKSFVLVDFDRTSEKGIQITSHVYLLLKSDSNPIRRTVQEFWAAVDAGKAENDTYR